MLRMLLVNHRSRLKTLILNAVHLPTAAWCWDQGRTFWTSPPASDEEPASFISKCLVQGQYGAVIKVEKKPLISWVSILLDCTECNESLTCPASEYFSSAFRLLPEDASEKI